MRAYLFGNYYLSQIQQGIQAAHCMANMSVLYKHNTDQHSMYVEWASTHKTMIVLSGGNSADLAEIFAKFEELARFGDMNYPIAKFHEDEVSLNNAMTCVGIVLPEKVYGLAALCRDTRQVPSEVVESITPETIGEVTEYFTGLGVPLERVNSVVGGGLTLADAELANIIMNCRLA